jgi:hypothetical protein
VISLLRDGLEPYEPFRRLLVSRGSVEPLELQELGDLVELHRDGGIELRVVPRLLEL